MQSFRLLVRPDRSDAVIERCFLETSTIGLRVAEEQRVVLPRRLARAEAGGIEIGIKTVERGGGITTKAESDDLLADSLEARRRLKRLAEEVRPGMNTGLAARLAHHTHLAIAVSGGVDSMTLAAFAHRLRHKGGMGSVEMIHAVSPAVPPAATERVRDEGRARRLAPDGDRRRRI